MGTRDSDPVHFLHNIENPLYGLDAKGFWKRARHVLRKAVQGAKWQNFAAGIGTGAAYTTLHGLHWHPYWLTVIEMILFMINVTIFSVNLILLLINVSGSLRQGIATRHLLDPSTPLVAPLIVLDYGTICIGIMLYAQEFNGATDMNRFEGLFWSYLVFSVILCGSMTFVWFGHGKKFELRSFSMTGAFLVFPLMLVGTISFNTLRVIDHAQPNALAIWIIGYIFQGLGMAIAFIFITVHFYRSILYGYNRGASANSTFISVGPPGFTALTLIRLGAYGRTILPLHTTLPQEAADVIYYASLPMALCLLGLALYCWFFAMGPYIFTLNKHITLNPAAAWPLTFPSSGFILTLVALGDIFDAPAFYYLHAIFTGYVCLIYVVLLPTWLYRMFIPPNPSLLAARSQYYEEAYDHMNFWSTAKMADDAEQQFNEASLGGPVRRKPDISEADPSATLRG